MTTHPSINKNKGFFLMEVIIYSALFSIMMGGLIVIAYQLSDNTSDLARKVTTQEELNFVTKKIEWALTGVTEINTPTNNTSHKLSVNKTNFNQNPIIIQLDQSSGDIEFCINSCSSSNKFSPLTTKNIKVDDLTFEYLPPGTETPAGIRVNIEINGVKNNFTKYLKI